MNRIPTIVIGAGQAGLAMSYFLSRMAIAHVVLERGRIGERWHGERWESLRLLTPNWASALPGIGPAQSDPDAFMSAGAFAGYLTDYALQAVVPIQTGTTVHAVRRAGPNYLVETNSGTWCASCVVIATGHCDVPDVPAMAQGITADVVQLTPSVYRNPEQLPVGGVLVVGASATGVQIAHELQLTGSRPVTLAVGAHSRLPRIYRGRDIWHWLDAIGVLDDLWDQVRDIASERRKPSFQLVGRPDHLTLDLRTLQAAGVRLTGRLVAAANERLTFADDLPRSVAAAQGVLERLLARIDRCADARGAPLDPLAMRPVLFEPGPATLDLRAAGVRSIIWATGYRRDYRWLHVPVLDRYGEIMHDGGVTHSPGLFVLGLRFMRRRRSNFIGGVGRDAEEIAAEIGRHLVTVSNSRVGQAA